MSTNTVDSLLPCPFCGSAVVPDKDCNHSTAWEVSCGNLKCPAEPSVWATDRDSVVAKWNSRPADKPQDDDLPPPIKLRTLGNVTLNLKPQDDAAYALEPNGMGEGSVNAALAKAYDACDTAMEERDALREELKALRESMISMDTSTKGTHGYGYGSLIMPSAS